MPLLAHYDTPARVRDVPAGSPFYDAWSDQISDLIGGTGSGIHGSALYDPTVMNIVV